MLLKLESGQEYHVRFRHGRGITQNRTLATVQSENPALFLQDLALCHPNDQFNKAKGRKLALARAIESLPRAERKQIWAAYFAAIGGIR